MCPDLLIDVSRLIWRMSSGRLPTGIDRVCLAYVAHYSDRAQAVVQWKEFRRILPPVLSRALFDLILAEPSDFRPRVKRLGVRSVPHLPWPRSGKDRLYLNIGHSGLDQPGLAEWIRRTRVRPIFMLHDLIPITHPHHCRPGSMEKHEKRLDLMLGTATGIIGNSQDTLDILAHHAKAHGRTMPTTVAAWLGVTPLPAIIDTGQREDCPPHPYFVVLGTIEGRKNHLLLLRIWKELIARHGDAAPRLVIIGQRGWEAEDVFAMLDGDPELRGHVTELPRCTDVELAHWLRGACALLFPSFAEGYGMPLVEALGHDTPVIANDLKVFRELAGSIPDYLSPTDQVGWRRMIELYSETGSTARAAQLKRMAGYAMPNWTEHFAAVDQWLASLERPPDRADPASLSGYVQ